MSTIFEALLALEPSPPDEVRPRPVPFMPRLLISVSRPPGCTTWRVSVLVHLEPSAPHALETVAPTSIDGWSAALTFVENATGQVLR